MLVEEIWRGTWSYKRIQRYARELTSTAVVTVSVIYRGSDRDGSDIMLSKSRSYPFNAGISPR